METPRSSSTYDTPDALENARKAELDLGGADARPHPAGVDLTGWGWRHAGRRAWALRGLDLRIEPGERVLLLGPSGAGKTTLLHGLAGLLDPEGAAEHEGQALVDGMPARQARARSALLFQDPETSLVMARAGDDVAFGLENLAVPPAQIWTRVDEALRLVGFPYGRDRRTESLSGGEQQRLALAGVIAARPGLVLLDEPTANLDPQGADLVRAAVGRVISETGATLILVEHRIAEALPLVDRVVVVEAGGGVVADGPPDHVFADVGRSLAERGVWVPGAVDSRRRPRAGPVGERVLIGSGLTLRYPGSERPAVSGADVTVHAGELLALTGPNGSGKSTLALMLAGLLRPAAGASILADAPGRPLHRWRARDLVRRIGTVFQDPEHQFLHRTVLDELTVGPLRTGATRDAAVGTAYELLDRLRLRHLAGANPFTLSGGEKRRLSVATALATAPDVLVLDEPTFGQDARTWSELVEMCSALRADGRAILAVTHDTSFVEALADRRIELPPGSPS